MSQIYYLELTEAATPIDQLARDLHAVAVAAGLLADDTPPEAFAESVVPLPGGVMVDVSTPLRRGPDQFTTDFGIERAARVEFQVDGSRDFAPQLHDVLAVTTGLLDRLAADADAVLHFEYDVVWLLRRDGRLYLNEDDDLWRPDRVALITQPYERAPLAFSDVTHARGSG
jgi:hypothetical protein